MATRPSEISNLKFQAPRARAHPPNDTRAGARRRTADTALRSRVARLADAEAVHALIEHYAAQGLLLPRTLENVRECISHFLVMTDGASAGKIVGCVALEPYGTDLAEVRSLAIAKGYEGHGLGARLLRFAVAVAKRRRIARVFAVTHAPDFFTHQGFTLTVRQQIPEKLARDCDTCPKRHNCHLTAVIFNVLPQRVSLPILQGTHVDA